MYTKAHFSSMVGYIGVGFIGGSISHGFFSGTRSIIMAIIGIILFILSEYLQEGEKNYGHLLVGGLVYSIAVGMVSGGFQHFLDSPMRSLWIIPAGWFVSTAIFPYKEGLIAYDYKKSLLTGGAISLALAGLLYGAIHILPDGVWAGGDHHASEDDSSAHSMQPGHTMNHADMVSDELSFLGEMIPHHQEAVDSSQALLTRATNPKLIAILYSIVSGQAEEISMMQKRMSDMSGGSSYKPMYMKMMSDVSTIRDVSQLEHIYITDMIAHHQGAVDMATKVLALRPRDKIAAFARQIIADQNIEIQAFKRLLEKY